ncbi:MAG: hypothetical protein HUU30_20405 [Burkholderiaceae bacterium]|jgi:hypothetical protein|nr:hypothetical protein [Aquabacterium sp.]NUP88089.1 hypothetical protein [Burkholderiaceae bacterium]
MGAILIHVPDFGDDELMFDEGETRQILGFFWPGSRSTIHGLDISNDAKRLAQTALVAAIDGSYAMGYVESLFRSVVRPGSGIPALAKKLARRFIKHWWRHATQDDLRDAKVYESVRVDIARTLRHRIELIQQGAALPRGTLHWYANVQAGGQLWC